MIFRIFAASLMALLAGTLVESARAGQSFICEDGTLVRVEVGQMERMKRENPCVAKHFGLTVVAKIVPLPVRRPPGPALRTRRAEPARAPEPSNYRSVRILNARDGASKWFHHRR